VTVRDKKKALVIYSPVGFGVVPGIPFATFDNAAKDVTALLANVQFTYSAGVPNTVQVAAGDILRTLAEGFAYQVAASSAIDQHITTAGGVKLYVQPTGEGYNVKAFGAKGDGTTDDTSAIQAAINFVSAGVPSGQEFPRLRPSKVFIPGGDYKITSSLIISRQIWLTGDGSWSTRLICTTSGASFYAITMVPTVLKIWGSIIENLAIYCKGGTTICSGILTGSLAPLTISQSVYQNIIIADCATGVYIGDGAGGNGDNTFYNNRFFNFKIWANGTNTITQYGMRMSGAVYNTFEGIEVTGVGNSAYAFYLQAAWNTFTQIACDGVSYMDILGSSLRDFTVEGISATTPVSPSVLEVNRASMLQNITFIGCPTSKTPYGLAVINTDNSAYTISNLNLISLNGSASGNPSYPFLAAAGSKGTFQNFTTDYPVALRFDQYSSAVTQSRWKFSGAPDLTYNTDFYDDRGSALFVAATSVTVTLTKTQPDTSYFVTLGSQANKTFWISSKTTTSFVLNSSAVSSDTVDWILKR
jgi:hypothetical protein